MATSQGLSSPPLEAIEQQMETCLGWSTPLWPVVPSLLYIMILVGGVKASAFSPERQATFCCVRGFSPKPSALPAPPSPTPRLCHVIPGANPGASVHHGPRQRFREAARLRPSERPVAASPTSPGAGERIFCVRFRSPPWSQADGGRRQ